VLCEGGIEVLFVGEYIDMMIEGVYVCCVCGVELFCSDIKFVLYCGWLLFYSLLVEDCVEYIEDILMGMCCFEVCCASCGLYFGYVFEGEGYDMFID